jgi:hypothetical protein
MTGFDWSGASEALANFGGEKQTFRVPKTGLPFFDVLRLYGTIDLYVGLRDEVTIHDTGHEWHVTAKVRLHQDAAIREQVNRAAGTLKGSNLTNRDHSWIDQLKAALSASGEWPTADLRNVSTPLENPDSALKDGVRGTAALTYKGLETGYGKESKVSYADALLAYAGQKRTETIASIFFLPVFEGVVDFTKVVSPLRAWVGIPNVLCVQVLTLLALKTSLFAEGYADRLSAVVYNTDLDPRKFYNYSGIITLRSTALGGFPAFDASKFSRFVGHFYRTFRSLVSRAWDRSGKSTGEVEDALTHAYWLLQPGKPKNLSALVTSLERQKREGKPVVIIGTRPQNESYVKEMFEMSYGKWQGDHEALRRFAKAVASGIWYARQAGESEVEERNKAWYDEVTMLRSAPSAKAFRERVLILIEQGKRKSMFVGTDSRGEDFDPTKILASIGETRSEFETFRDLFRMYLIQESKPPKAVGTGVGDTGVTLAETEPPVDETEGEIE